MPDFQPGVSILKPVKGIDQRMYIGLVSHCQQQYAGSFEIVFGVSSLNDPAVAEIERLRSEFPAIAIRLVECHERLGTPGKCFEQRPGLVRADLFQRLDRSQLAQLVRLQRRTFHLLDQHTQRALCIGAGRFLERCP